MTRPLLILDTRKWETNEWAEMSLQCNSLLHIFSIMTIKIGMIVTMEMMKMLIKMRMILLVYNDVENDIVGTGKPG